MHAMKQSCKILSCAVWNPEWQFPKSQRQCGGLESLFGILRRVPVNLAEWVDLPDILPRAYTKVLLSEISLE